MRPILKSIKWVFLLLFFHVLSLPLRAPQEESNQTPEITYPNENATDPTRPLVDNKQEQEAEEEDFAWHLDEETEEENFIH